MERNRKNRNHQAIDDLLQDSISDPNPDVVALYVARYFYFIIMPDRDKAVSAANKLKVVAAAIGDPDFIALAESELNELQEAPDDGWNPSNEVIDFLHEEFKDEFPMIEIAIQLRRYVEK